MQVVRWPTLDVIESNLHKIDDFYYRTNKGPILAGLIFPISQLDNLRALKSRIEEKRKELSAIEAEIYRISRDFTK